MKVWFQKHESKKKVFHHDPHLWFSFLSFSTLKLLYVSKNHGFTSPIISSVP